MNAEHVAINGTCPRCKNKNLDLKRKALSPQQTELQSIYRCTDCGKFSFATSEWHPSKPPVVCKHINVIPKSIVADGYPSTLNIGYVLGKLCIDCGTTLFTCINLKNKIDKVYPHFWKNVRDNPKILFLPCEYCEGKVTTDLEEERSHASVRAFELVQEKNTAVYNFFLTDPSELTRLKEKAYEIYIEMGKIGFGNRISRLLFRGRLSRMVAKREAVWEQIKEWGKKLDFYYRMAANEHREQFGLPLIGEGWISETRLYKLVQSAYKDDVVLFHTRPTWLEGLELDIFLPDRGLALEYMGKQHYEPVGFFGGEDAWIKRRENDDRKVLLCNRHGVKLIHFDYRMDVNESNLQSVLAKAENLL